MARTKASVGSKVSSGKSSKARCSVAPPSTSGTSSGGSERASRNHSGGNPVCPRETPKWQKPITNFFIVDANGNVTDDVEDALAAGSSRPKRNVIESDDESTATAEDSPGKSNHSPLLQDDSSNSPERPKNRELDETFELEPLDGEKSHKIEEYYPNNGVKGKGIGKKTKDKENIDDNVKRNSTKRDLEDVIFGEESEHVGKKIKIGS